MVTLRTPGTKHKTAESLRALLAMTRLRSRSLQVWGRTAVDLTRTRTATWTVRAPAMEDQSQRLPGPETRLRSWSRKTSPEEREVTCTLGLELTVSPDVGSEAPEELQETPDDENGAQEECEGLKRKALGGRRVGGRGLLTETEAGHIRHLGHFAAGWKLGYDAPG